MRRRKYKQTNHNTVNVNQKTKNTHIKHLITLLLILFFISSCTNTSGEKNTDTCICDKHLCDYCVKVVSISDGDTFRGLTEENEEIKFRIYEIDAPQKNQAFGNRLSKYFADLIFGKKVGIKVQNPYSPLLPNEKPYSKSSCYLAHHLQWLNSKIA